MPFEREQTFTATVTPGGDHWSPQDPPRDVLCELLDCLRRGALGPEFLKRLEGLGLNIEALLKCLDRKCRTYSEGGKRGEAHGSSPSITTMPVNPLAQVIDHILRR